MTIYLICTHLKSNELLPSDSTGTVSQDDAREKAYSEYEKYKLIQDKTYISDFDRFNEGEDDNQLLPFDLNPTK